MHTHLYLRTFSICLVSVIKNKSYQGRDNSKSHLLMSFHTHVEPNWWIRTVRADLELFNDLGFTSASIVNGQVCILRSSCLACLPPWHELCCPPVSGLAVQKSLCDQKQASCPLWQCNSEGSSTWSKLALYLYIYAFHYISDWNSAPLPVMYWDKSFSGDDLRRFHRTLLNEWRFVKL